MNKTAATARICHEANGSWLYFNPKATKSPEKQATIMGNEIQLAIRKLSTSFTPKALTYETEQWSRNRGLTSTNCVFSHYTQLMLHRNFSHLSIFDIKHIMQRASGVF